MELGSFSVSLAVKDIAASRAFYEKLGFTSEMDGSEGWLILKNGDTVIGLFQGMFEGNIMTFNPGWDQSAGELDSFTDVRDIRKQLEAAGIELVTDNTSESDSGPAHITLVDPDGNAILIDQHR
jgi:lactoylglutathione lyase